MVAARVLDQWEEIASLESGDQLTRDEFERRYEAAPEGLRAELIEGVVYLASPVSLGHGDAHYNLITWFGTYSVGDPNVQGSDNATLRLDLDNEPQPDVMLRKVEGGSSRMEGPYLAGAPELVAEVAVSSFSIDLNQKLNAYRRNGVQEYIVWRVRDREIDWFSLEGGAYELLQADERGIVHSKVFPGLRLSVAKMLEGDMAAVVAEQLA